MTQFFMIVGEWANKWIHWNDSFSLLLVWHFVTCKFLFPRRSHNAPHGGEVEERLRQERRHREQLHLARPVRLHGQVPGGVHRGDCRRSRLRNMIYSGFFFWYFLISGEFPGVIMTIVLRRKIQYHLLQVRGSLHPWMVNVNQVTNMQNVDINKGQRGTQWLYHCQECHD